MPSFRYCLLHIPDSFVLNNPARYDQSANAIVSQSTCARSKSIYELVQPSGLL